MQELTRKDLLKSAVVGGVSLLLPNMAFADNKKRKITGKIIPMFVKQPVSPVSMLDTLPEQTIKDIIIDNPLDSINRITTTQWMKSDIYSNLKSNCLIDNFLTPCQNPEIEQMWCCNLKHSETKMQSANLLSCVSDIAVYPHVTSEKMQRKPLQYVKKALSQATESLVRQNDVNFIRTLNKMSKEQSLETIPTEQNIQESINRLSDKFDNKLKEIIFLVHPNVMPFIHKYNFKGEADKIIIYCNPYMFKDKMFIFTTNTPLGEYYDVKNPEQTGLICDKDTTVAVLSAYSLEKQEVGWMCYHERGFGLYENAKFETLAWKNKETHNE